MAECTTSLRVLSNLLCLFVTGAKENRKEFTEREQTELKNLTVNGALHEDKSSQMIK